MDYKYNSITKAKFPKLGSVFLLLTLVVLFLDMGGDIGLRRAFLPICLLFIVCNYKMTLPKSYLGLFALYVVYPSVLLLSGLLADVDMQVALSQFQGLLFGLLMVLIFYGVDKNQSIEAYVNASVITAFVANLLAIGLFFEIPLIVNLVQHLSESQGGFFGNNLIGDFIVFPNIYFKSTLFFIPAFLICFFKERLVCSTVLFLALVFAISKTGIFICLLIVFSYLFKSTKLKTKFSSIFVAIFIMAIVCLSPISILLNDIASGNSVTVDVRKGHFTSLIEYWSIHPISFIFGAGLGSGFYSVGNFVTNIEIDHFNLIRKHGVIWFLFFFLSSMSISLRLIKDSDFNKKLYGCALFITFIVAGTNPVLITPLYFVLLGIAMAHAKTRTGSIEEATYE